MKKIVSIVLTMLMVTTMVACGNKTKEEVSLKMIYPDGLPAIGLSKFISDNNSIDNVTLNYEMQKTPDALLAELMKGQADLVVVPSNLALKVAEKDLKYKVAGTVGWGSLYLVTTESVSSIDELKGVEIYNTGKGLTPDIISKNILKNNGFSDEDMNFTYVSAASELAPVLIGGKAKAAIVPEPVLSTIMAKNPNLNIVLNLNDEWAKSYNSKLGYPQSTLLIKDDVFNKLKDDGRLEEILNELDKSVDWVKSNPEESGLLCEKLGITVNKDILGEALKNANLDFVSFDKEQDAYKIYFDAIDSNGVDYSRLFSK